MKELKNYNFDLIIPSEVLEERKKDARNIEIKKVKKYRLKRWCKCTLLTVIFILLVVTIIQFFTTSTYVTTPSGSYNCNGGWLKVCAGSREVAALVE